MAQEWSYHIDEEVAASEQAPILDNPEAAGENSAVDEMLVGDRTEETAETAAEGGGTEDYDSETAAEGGGTEDSESEAAVEGGGTEGSDSEVEEEKDEASGCKVDSDGNAVGSRSFLSPLAGVPNWRLGPTGSARRR